MRSRGISDRVGGRSEVRNNRKGKGGGREEDQTCVGDVVISSIKVVDQLDKLRVVPSPGQNLFDLHQCFHHSPAPQQPDRSQCPPSAADLTNVDPVDGRCAFGDGDGEVFAFQMRNHRNVRVRTTSEHGQSLVPSSDIVALFQRMRRQEEIPRRSQVPRKPLGIFRGLKDLNVLCLFGP
eukprot:165033-Hanusia_phi.AAC.1